MTQVITGMITHGGIALAGAPTRQRKRIRGALQAAIHRVLSGLRCRPVPSPKGEPANAPVAN